MNFDEKISRSRFLKASSAALFTPLFSGIDLSIKKGSNIGIQLYTLRDQINNGLEEVLKRISEIGYREVETFSYADGKFFGKTPAEVAALFKKYNLSAVSGHYGLGKENPNAKGTILNGWDRAVEDAAKIGQKYMMLAYLTPSERTSIEDYKRYVDILNKAGETAAKAGIQFGYHNHDFELQPLNGELPYDYLAGKTDPKLVKLELDLYWAVKAGFNPVDLFKKYPGRFPLWHVKDIDKTDGSFAEVGTGSIDFKPIFAARKLAGMTHFFVEQDVTKNPVYDAITTSIGNLKKWKV